MSLPTPPDRDDLPPPNEDDPPNPAVWLIGGFSLVLAYIIALALLHRTV